MPDTAYIPEMVNIPVFSFSLIKKKKKREQVKIACVNCQKSCKKCAVSRPCPRCVKMGLTDTCVNVVKKQRKPGIKRGPYNKHKNLKLEILAAVCSSYLENENNVKQQVQNA